MLTGQIGLCRHGSTLIARLIEWDTYSHAHHVVVYISETHVVSAEPGGVKLRPASDYHHLDVSDFALTDTQRTAIIRHAIDAYYRHLPYNLAVFPVLFLHRIFRARVPNWLSGWLSERPNTDCSQLADDIYNAAGIDLFTAANVLTTPGDFDRLFVARGWLPATERVKETV